MKKVYITILLVINGLAIILFIYLSHVYWKTDVLRIQQNLTIQSSEAAALLDHRLALQQQFLHEEAIALSHVSSISAINHALYQLQQNLKTDHVQTIAVVTDQAMYLSRIGPFIPIPKEIFRHSVLLSPPFSNVDQKGQFWILEGSPLPNAPHRLVVAIYPLQLSTLYNHLHTSLYPGFSLQLERTDGTLQSQSPLPPHPALGKLQSDWISQQIAHTPLVQAGMGMGAIRPNGSVHLIAFTKLTNYPLYVVSSIPLHSVFLQWLHSMLLGIFAFLLLAFLSDAGILLILNRLNVSREHHAFTLQLYESLSKVNHITSNAMNESECFQTLIPALCEGTFYAAWFGVLQEDVIHVLFAAGPGTDDLRKIPFDLSEEREEYQPLALRSIKLQQTLYDNEITEARTHQGYVTFLKTHHWSSAISIPIVRQHRIWGVLTLVSDHANAFKKTILPLANQIGRSLQDALERIDLRVTEAQYQRKNEINLSFHRLLGLIAEISQQNMTEGQLLQLLCDALINRDVFAGAWIGIP